jgi:D-serine deaminase-like pyridoxal phosphate-dependent protein
MVAGCGAPDVLLAYQPVGPTARRLLELTERYPTTVFSVIGDDAGALHTLSSVFASVGRRISVLLDLDIGQHRTGVTPGREAVELYRTVSKLAGLEAGGLHAYDGHIHMSDVEERARACEEAFAPVAALKHELIAAGLPVPTVVTSGTPTFPMHIKRPEVQCSPGTTVLWDYGYATEFPDLDFLIAAVVMTRVVSKPGPRRLCLDLGHKAVASEMPHPRVFLPELPEAKFVAHNEEHLVLETDASDRYRVGDVLYGWPRHVCPTVNLHSEVWVASEGQARECWAVTARARRLTV